MEIETIDVYSDSEEDDSEDNVMTKEQLDENIAQMKKRIAERKKKEKEKNKVTINLDELSKESEQLNIQSQTIKFGGTKNVKPFLDAFKSEFETVDVTFDNILTFKFTVPLKPKKGYDFASAPRRTETFNLNDYTFIPYVNKIKEELMNLTMQKDFLRVKIYVKNDNSSINSHEEKSHTLVFSLIDSYIEFLGESSSSNAPGKKRKQASSARFIDKN